MKTASRKRRAPNWLPEAQSRIDHRSQRIVSLFESGVRLQNSGHFPEANSTFQKVANLLERAHIQDATIYGAIGYTHLMMAQPKECLEQSEKALAIDPKLLQPLINASAALRFLNRLEEAKKYAERALELDPANPQPMGALAMILANQNKPSQALVRASYAYALNPECLDAVAALASAFSSVGDMAEAARHYDLYLAKRPFDAGMYGSMLFNLHYKPDVTKEELREAHRVWGERFAARFKKDWPQHANDRTPHRRYARDTEDGDDSSGGRARRRTGHGPDQTASPPGESPCPTTPSTPPPGVRRGVRRSSSSPRRRSRRAHRRRPGPPQRCTLQR